MGNARQDEDDLALEKYQRQDEAKVKELNLHIEKMCKEVADMRQALADEVTETQSHQIQLDKTAEDFRRLHEERQDFVRQWDEAMEAMRKRDEMIQVASERYADQKLSLRERKFQLDQQAKFFDNEVANNKEFDARIAAFDREVGKLRVVYGREKDKVDEFVQELEILKTTLGKTANELAVKRSENAHIKAELEEKRRRLDAMRKDLVVTNRKLEGEFAQLETIESKVNELESMFSAEEKRLAAQIKAVADMKKVMFKESQRLFELRNQERDLIAEIAGGQAQNKNLAGNISKNDSQVVKQQELLYNAEFQVQQLERKVQRAGGERSDDEKRALNARIEKLTSQLEGVNAEHSMLTEQVKLVEDALQKARRYNNNMRADDKQMHEKIHEIRLISNSAQRNVDTAVKAKEDKMVEHDVLKLELERLRGILNLKADEVFSLENRKFQLQQSMEERKHEVEVHLEGLRAELKLLREDVHRVTVELKEREMKVEKLASKYEVMTSKQQQEEGEEVSQAYYVIKAAQEREELQRRGDDLDTKIRKVGSRPPPPPLLLFPSLPLSPLSPRSSRSSCPSHAPPLLDRTNVVGGEGGPGPREVPREARDQERRLRKELQARRRQARLRGAHDAAAEARPRLRQAQVQAQRGEEHRGGHRGRGAAAEEPRQGVRADGVPERRARDEARRGRVGAAGPEREEPEGRAPPPQAPE